jgi:dTDP-glucose pyrophosphorylase
MTSNSTRGSMLRKNILIGPDFSIKETLKRLNEAGEKTLLVVDKSDCLLGTITDGDIRRHILEGISIESTISNLYNKSPIFLKRSDYSHELSQKMLIDHKIELLPIIDEKRHVVDFTVWNESDVRCDGLTKGKASLDLPVVIMAGGKGTRMAPFTSILPKPLIPIGEKTVLELIIEGFREFGIRDYYLTLNHKGEMIQAYFNSIEKDYNIHFITEKAYLGTAGSLKLVKDSVGDTFIVSNCDIIVRADYAEVVEFHRDNKAELTILSSIQRYCIPYGVVQFRQGGEVTQLIEKPEYTFTINTGVYILNRECLNLIPRDTFYNMTDLIETLISQDRKVLTYPVNESDYIDIGQWKEYREAVRKLS